MSSQTKDSKRQSNVAAFEEACAAREAGATIERIQHIMIRAYGAAAKSQALFVAESIWNAVKPRVPASDEAAHVPVIVANDLTGSNKR